MSEYERMVLMAEDELTQYSTDARKIEKLRRKLGISTSIKQRQEAPSLREGLFRRGTWLLVGGCGLRGRC